MGTSQVDICNMALSAAGTRSSIASLDEGSAEAIQCGMLWDQALEETLSGCPWNFARKQKALAVLKDATQGQAVPIPWQYEYAVPSNLVDMRFLLPYDIACLGLGERDAQLRGVRFIMASDEDAQGNDINVLLTNEPNAIAVYTGRIANTDLFDGQFVSVFVLVLGAKLTIPLNGDTRRMNTLTVAAQQKLVSAAANNGNNGLTVIEHDPDWLTSRGLHRGREHPWGM